MIGFLQIGYLILSIAQFFAVIDFFGGGFLGFVGAVFVAPLPLFGTVFGVLGAHNEWGWSWTQSFLLFGGPFLLMLGFLAISSVFDRD